MRLQRIARRDEQPDLIEPQPLAGEIGDVPMPRMGRVERAAKQTDARAAAIAEAGQGIDQRGVQGRTCPLPRTT